MWNICPHFHSGLTVSMQMNNRKLILYLSSYSHDQGRAEIQVLSSSASKQLASPPLISCSALPLDLILNPTYAGDRVFLATGSSFHIFIPEYKFHFITFALEKYTWAPYTGSLWEEWYWLTPHFPQLKLYGPASYSSSTCGLRLAPDLWMTFNKGMLKGFHLPDYIVNT